MSQFGDRIKQLREQKGLLQRQVASQLDIDTPMLSKIERGERNAKREQIARLGKILTVPEDDLLSLWLTDQLYDVIKGEPMADEALKQVSKKIKTTK